MAHRRAKASVIDSASNLFESDNDDFFSSLNDTSNASNHQQPNHIIAPFTHGQGIGTVFEEEEPISPEIPSAISGRPSPSNNHDWSNHSQRLQEPQLQQQQQQQQSYQYDSNNYSQQLQDSAYSQSSQQPQDYQQEYLENDYSSHLNENDQSNDSYAPEIEYEEPPYYYGYIYDPVSNTYLPDPNIPQDSWSGDQSTESEIVDEGYQGNENVEINDEWPIQVDVSQYQHEKEQYQPEEEPQQNQYQNYQQNYQQQQQQQQQQQHEEEQPAEQYQEHYNHNQQDFYSNQEVEEEEEVVEHPELYDTSAQSQYQNQYNSSNDSAVQQPDSDFYQSYAPQSNEQNAYQQSSDDFYSGQYQQSSYEAPSNVPKVSTTTSGPPPSSQNYTPPTQTFAPPPPQSTTSFSDNHAAPPTRISVPAIEVATPYSNSQYSDYSNQPEVIQTRSVSPPRAKSIPPPPKSSTSPAQVPPPRRPVSSATERESVFTLPLAVESAVYLSPDYPYSNNETGTAQADYEHNSVDSTHSTTSPEYAQPLSTNSNYMEPNYGNQAFIQENGKSRAEASADIHAAGQKLAQESTWDEPIDTSTVSFLHDNEAADRAKDSLESPTAASPPFRPTWEDYRMQSKSPTSSYIRPPRMNFDNSEQNSHVPSLSASMLTLALASPPPQPLSQFQLQPVPRAQALPSPPMQPLHSPPLQSLTTSPLQSLTTSPPQSQYQPYQAQPLLPAQTHDFIDQRFAVDSTTATPPVPEQITATNSIFEENYNIRGSVDSRVEERREYGLQSQENRYNAPVAPAQENEAEYGFDDSQVFQEEDLSHSHASSGYGEWNGESDAGQGYDYVESFGGNYSQDQVSNPYSQQPQQPQRLQQPQQPQQLNYNPQTPPPAQFIPQYDVTRDVRSNSTYSLSPTELPHERNASVPSYSNNNFSESYDQQSTPNDYSQHQYQTSQVSVQPPVAYSQSIPPQSQRNAPPTTTNSYLPSQALSPPRQASRSPQKATSTYSSPRKYSSTSGSPLRGEANQSAAQMTQNNPYDSYAPYPTSSIPEDQTYQNNGNVTAPAAFGNDLQSQQQQQQQQQQYSSYTPYSTKVDRRYSFDATPANYSAATLEPTSRPLLGRAISAPAAAIDLGLERSRAPVVSFAFGGRMLVVFPGMFQQPSYGQPQTIDESSPSIVHIRKVEEILPPDEFASFPGPMFMDGGKTNTGKKRKDALTWLDGRIIELEEENVHRHNRAFGKVLATKEDARLVLVKLVRALVENEGKLSGTPKIEDAVRLILTPNAMTDNGESDFLNAYPSATPASTGPPIATYTVTSSDLDRMTAFLSRGERRKAVRYALDHKLWAQALVISSCVDTNCWQEVVNAFLQCELGKGVDGAASGSNGREGLRVAYAMFAGLSARETVQQFLPPIPQGPSSVSLYPPSSYNAPISRATTPISAGFVNSALTRDAPEAILEQWQETAAMIVANRFLGDSPAMTLSALGDTLLANDWIDAAHVCYLLAPLNSAFGMVPPLARIALLGASSPATITLTTIGTESIILTELVEFAFSLAPTVKSQEPFVGFPHFQAFRLLHASRLADAGHVVQAHKYTEAIVSTLKLATKPSPFYNSELVDQVKSLTDRLNSAPGHDKGASWITRNVPRPTIDSLWSTMEGKFSKFVSGDGESKPSGPLRLVPDAVKASTPAIGPFSHYSTISPASTSGTLSRTQSQTDLLPPVSQPPRSYLQSDLASTPPRNRQRPSSQGDLVGLPARSTSPIPTQGLGPPPVNRAQYMTHHVRSSSLGFAGYNYDPNATQPWQSYPPAEVQEQETTPKAISKELSDPSAYSYNALNYGQSEGDHETSASSSWYGAEASTGSSSMLRAPSFTPLEESFAEDESGFISPMAAYTPVPSPGLQQQSSAYGNSQNLHKRTSTREELDELGIGNSKSRKPAFDSIDEHAGEGEDNSNIAAKKEPEKPSLKPAKSWLGGWFKASPAATPTGPGPVKANLGEQTSFVYDPDLKRWVNKKVGETSSAPLATAPPPRAATTSPTSASRSYMQSSRYQSETPPPLPSGGGYAPPPLSRGSAMPPLNRARTSADLAGDSRAGEFRSSSVGPQMGMPPPPRPNSATGPPPSRSSTPGTVKRKPLAKRYVNVI